VDGPIENNQRTKKFATENHHKKGNNYFTYPVLRLPHRFLCCIWGFQCGVVGFRLGGKISHSVMDGHIEIIKEYKNEQQKTVTKIEREFFLPCAESASSLLMLATGRSRTRCWICTGGRDHNSAGDGGVANCRE
jgi:hypothetical protein